jgi:hypothetical protein
MLDFGGERYVTSLGSVAGVVCFDHQTVSLMQQNKKEMRKLALPSLAGTMRI